MGAIGLGGLVLALAASYWLARRTSLRMQSTIVGGVKICPRAAVS